MNENATAMPGASARRRRRRVIAGMACAVALMLAGWFAWQRAHAFDMRVELARIATTEGTWDTPWDQQERKVAALKAELAAERDPIRRLITKREIAQQYVNAGLVELGIASLEETIDEYSRTLGARDLATLRSDLAFAYYRLGEQQNCSTAKSADVCILPLQNGALHTKKLGAQEAIKAYSALLAEPGLPPDEMLNDRWFLNLAYMQLGEYPGTVPAQWLIPPQAFASDGDVGRFKDVAVQRGVAEFGRAGGLILEDFDNDGHLDLMISHMGMDDQLEYFRNDGDGHFTRRTDAAGLRGQLGGLNMVQADFDNDGCIDVYIPRGAWYHDKGRIPGSLLKNNCDGTFTDVTAKAGVMNAYPSQTAVWADFNNDGLLDLFIGNEIVRDKVAWPADTPSFRLFINQGDGTFVDVGPSSGIKVDGMIKGAAAADFMNDGWTGLYVSVMGGPNHLFRNVGKPGKVPQFVDVTDKAGVAEPVMSFTTWFFDYDNDGWPDLFVSGYTATVPNIVRGLLGDDAHAQGARARLYHNNHDGTFTDRSHELNLDQLLLTMGGNFGDLDNDGWLDFYVGTGAAPLYNVVPNRMFHNVGGQRFEDVTTSGGFGHLQKGHAIAFGDVDNDGNQDVFENIGGAMTGDKFYSVLFKNPGHANHWLKLDLTGVKANRFGVGARVKIGTIGADGKPFDVYRTVGSGGSFGASSLHLHVGLGPSASATAIEVRWPGSGTVQRFEGPIRGDTRYEVREDRATLVEHPVPASKPLVAKAP
jgi:hypothetical protein